jgi:hypothetical protein
MRLACVLVRQAAVYKKQNATSWLDPSGIFHPIAFSHDQWAADHGTTLEKLFDDGWLRITYYWKTLVIENVSYTPINERQRETLVEFAINSKWFEEVVDNSGERDHVIWSIKDEF